MSYEKTITLTVARRRDFHLLMAIACGLMLLATLISSKPLLLLIPIIILLTAIWHFPNVLFAKIPSQTNQISLTRAAGKSVLMNAGEPAEGLLCGTQWCTRYVAVLRCRSESVVRHMVFISAQQSPESFRQLCVWLRHNNSKEGRDQS